MRIISLFLLVFCLECHAQKTALWTGDRFSLFADSLVQPPQWSAKAVSATAILSYYTGVDATAAAPRKDNWTLSRDVSAFPVYHSPYVLTDALYNMALEEMQKAIEPDSTFRTGKEWAGVWTRDISYSIILSMAWLQPRVAMYSLLRKVSASGRIIQDTGTGGAWPVSCDRMIWAVAAWELYKVTGDRGWLRKAYGIIRASLEDDAKTVYDPVTGMVKGESSFLDWREQTYPAWMQPADIFESENLGTNAVHYEANIVLAKMARLLKEDAVALRHEAIAAKIRTGVNRYLWMPGQGYYGQYLYGRIDKVLSPRSEALGEALSVLFGIAGPDQARSVITRTPVMDFGIPCIYPEIPGIPPYHNEAVWPFVQTFWLWAAARTGNERAVMSSIADIYRPAALFLTNKENFVARDGNYQGTQINSSNMLWSLSGNLSIVYKLLFGMSFEEDRLSFHPFVPRALGGARSLTNAHYRDAVLDISMEGWGNRIRSFLVDGVASPTPALPASLKGKHRIRIVLANNTLPDQPVHVVRDMASPAAPVARRSGDSLTWTAVAGAARYRVYRDGRFFREAPDTMLALSAASSQAASAGAHAAPRPAPASCSLYQVAAIDAGAIDAGAIASFLSEPVFVCPPHAMAFYQVEQYAGNDAPSHSASNYTGDGFTGISRKKNRMITIPITIPQSGCYAVDFRYSNGNGPVNTENKCAIRNLRVDGHSAGALVFPQRGKEDWSNWGYSNALIFTLSSGSHVLTLSFDSNDENMNGAVNEALLDGLRVTRLPRKP